MALYVKSKWEDRKSQYPNRRKLLHNTGDGDDVYTIQRYEGTITQEGTIWCADTMDKFDTNIKNAFDSAENSINTAESNIRTVQNNLNATNTNLTNSNKRISTLETNLKIMRGTLNKPDFYNKHNGNYYAMRTASNTQHPSTVTSMYYCIGDMVYINVHFHNLFVMSKSLSLSNVTNNVDNNVLYLGPLPYPAVNSGQPFSLTVSEFLYKTFSSDDGFGQSSTVARIYGGEKYITFYVYYGGTAYDSTKLIGKYVDCSLSGIYFKK